MPMSADGWIRSSRPRQSVFGLGRDDRTSQRHEGLQQHQCGKDKNQ
jgi:hypothetical protein